jgi:hypothetical protein
MKIESHVTNVWVGGKPVRLAFGNSVSAAGWGANE